MNQVLTDPLQQMAAALFKATGRASLSELCAKLQIGFQRGQQLMYLLECDGLVTANVPLFGRKVTK